MVKRFVSKVTLIVGAVVALVLASVLALFVAFAGVAAACSPPPAIQDAGAQNLPLFQAIKLDAWDNRHDPELAVSMVGTSWLENKWQNTSPPQGPAYGPYQIEHPADAPMPGKPVNPGITVAQAEDPSYATNYMLPRYIKARQNIDQSLWASNPELAMDLTGYHAENPARDYMNGRAADVHIAFVKAKEVLNQLGIPTNFGSSQSTAVQDAPPMDATQAASCVNATGDAQKVLQAASKWIGYPYVYGGGNINGPTSSLLAHGNYNDVGFDCSSLVQYAYHAVGIDLPRTSTEQFAWAKAHGHIIPLGQEQPADLAFMAGSDGTQDAPGHVGLVYDKAQGTMLNAYQTGEKIGFNSYTNARGLTIVRILPDNIGSASFVPAVSGGWTDPLKPGSYVLSSPFGMRYHPVLHVNKLHTGQDMAPLDGAGDPIFAAANGTVEKTLSLGESFGDGNYVVIRHDAHTESAYAHMIQWASGIQPGVQVSKGQVIGYVGSTGYTTGPHLHFEIKVDNSFVDPVPFMAARGVKL